MILQTVLSTNFFANVAGHSPLQCTGAVRCLIPTPKTAQEREWLATIVMSPLSLFRGEVDHLMSSKVLTLKGVDLHELVTEPPRHKDCYLNAPCKRCTNKVGLGVISSLSNVLTDNNAWFLSKEIAAKFIQKAYLEAFDKARMAMLSNAFNYWD